MASCLFFLTCVMLTGERSNTIKAIIGLSIFFSLNNKFTIKYRLITFLSLIIVTATVISNSNYLKYRYFENIVNPILNVEKRFSAGLQIILLFFLHSHAPHQLKDDGITI